MGSQEFLNICKAKVAEYYNQKKDKTDTAPTMTVNDVFVVWYSKSLQNHKALLSTPVSDGMYYELTYNGDKNELYFDAYKKWENICYPMYWALRRRNRKERIMGRFLRWLKRFFCRAKPGCEHRYRKHWCRRHGPYGGYVRRVREMWEN